MFWVWISNVKVSYNHPGDCLFQVLNTGLLSDRIWIEVPGISCYHGSTCINTNFTSGITVHWKTVKVVFRRVINPYRVPAELIKGIFRLSCITCNALKIITMYQVYSLYVKNNTIKNFFKNNCIQKKVLKGTILFFCKFLNMRCSKIGHLFLCDVDGDLESYRTQHMVQPGTCRHDQLPAIEYSFRSINLMGSY